MNFRLATIGGASSLFILLGSLASGMVKPTLKKTDGAVNAVYVKTAGDDANTGLDSENAVKTMKKAFELVDDEGTIVVCGDILSGISQEIYDAKSVKITSKYNGEDYSSSYWKVRTDIFFQDNVDIDDIQLYALSNAGFCANGHDFHIGTGVSVTGNSYFNVVGGTGPLTNVTMSTKNGANVVIEGGSNWDIFAAGSNAFANCGDEIHTDGDVNVTVKGTASVHALYGAFNDSTYSGADTDGSVSTIGNVTLNLEDQAKVQQIIVGSSAQCNARMHQNDDCAFTVNLGKDTTVSALIGGGLYCYENPSATLVGPESLFNEIIINYYGANVGEMTIGGVEIPYPYPGKNTEDIGFIESIKDFRINLYESFVGDITPGYIQDAYGQGHPLLSSETVDKVTVAIYNGSTFSFDDYSDPTYEQSGIYPFELKNRAVCYMDSGDRENPMGIPADFNPNIIEFGTDNEDKESVENNVFSTGSDMTISGIHTDDSNFTFVLKGDEMPIVTIEDEVTTDGGKFNLSFEKDDGTSYVPEEDTVIFQVPAATTEEEKQQLAAMFMVEGMDTDEYYLEYEEGVDEEGNPIGQIVVKKKQAPVALPVSYQVEHYQEQLDGTFVLIETEELSGTEGETVNAVAKSYEHYHVDASNENAVNSLVLSAEASDSEKVLKVYYKLDTYTVIYHANVYGTFDGNQTKIIQEYRYGSALGEAPVVVSQDGYVFDYWIDANGNKVTDFPTTVEGNQVYTAVWKTVSTPCEIPEDDQPMDNGNEDEEKPLFSHEVNIILHVIVGIIIGFILSMIFRAIKQKIRKGHLTNGLNVGKDE